MLVQFDDLLNFIKEHSLYISRALCLPHRTDWMLCFLQPTCYYEVSNNKKLRSPGSYTCCDLDTFLSPFLSLLIPSSFSVIFLFIPSV